MPCDYSKYPANWKTEIVPAIRERSGNQCEYVHADTTRCTAKNGDSGWWFDGVWHDAFESHAVMDYGRFKFGEPRKVVLTVAHLNHDTTDNRPENLLHMCQLHHLRYDAILHASNASKTRDEKRGQTRMNFDQPQPGEPTHDEAKCD